MDIASQAIVGGLLRVAAGAIAAVFMYRIAAPSADSRGPIASGRRFFAWTAAISCLTYFGKWVLDPSADHFALWAIAVVVFGGAAFLIGLAWGALKTRGDAATSKPRVTKGAPGPWNPEAKRILEVRLAKGEISISEFKALISTLGGSVSELKEESKAPRSLPVESVAASTKKEETSQIVPVVPRKLPEAKDFSDPATAKAVQAMRDALDASGRKWKG